MKTHAGVRGSEIEDLGELGWREALPRVEGEDLTLSGTESKQRTVDIEVQIAVARKILGLGIRLRLLEIHEPRTAPLRAIVLAHDVAGDAVEPREDAAFNLVEVDPSALEDVGGELLDVLGGRAARKERAHGRVMRPESLAKDFPARGGEIGDGH